MRQQFTGDNVTNDITDGDEQGSYVAPWYIRNGKVILLSFAVIGIIELITLVIALII